MGSQRAELRRRRPRDFGLLAFVASIAAVWFSVVIATIPGEWQETALAAITAHDLLFAGEVNHITRRRKSLFSNTLVLPGFNIYDALKIDDPKKLAWKERLVDLRVRHLEHAVFNGADLTKADLTGAQLQGASLVGAQLQGASLDGAELQGAALDEARFQGASLARAHLQGASLSFAQLQGASLGGARLQGATLDYAQLQGASLYGAQLQGAALDGAQLQGASLLAAQLQGALLRAAQLQGASLDNAQLQGALLRVAKLQGASLEGAELNATDFSGAFLWRSKRGKMDPAKIGAIWLEAALEWKPVWLEYHLNPFTSDPVSWDAKAYAELRNSMNSIPEGKMRDDALKRIETLDCANSKTLASCHHDAKPPPEVLDWQKTLLKAKVDNAAFQKALATELRSLVCASDANAIHILRGETKSNWFAAPRLVESRLAATGREAPALVDYIMSKDCPVSVALTGDDKARLLRIKQDAEKNFPPPPEPKKEN